MRAPPPYWHSPFAFEPRVVGIADEVADVDDAGRHALVLAEGIAIPIGHVAVAEHSAAGCCDGRQAVEVVVRVPAAEVNHFDGIERDELPVDLVEVAGDYACRIGHDGYAVGAQHPDLARASCCVAGQEPVGVAMQFQRAQGLLKKLEAAGQWIGLAEQLLQRVVGDADAPLGVQAKDSQRHQSAGFDDAVDGDVDPGRLLVDADGIHLDGRTELVAAMRG